MSKWVFRMPTILLKLRSTSRLVILSKNLRIGTLALMTSNLVRNPVDIHMIRIERKRVSTRFTYGTVLALFGRGKDTLKRGTADQHRVLIWLGKDPCHYSRHQNLIHWIRQCIVRIDGGNSSESGRKINEKNVTQSRLKTNDQGYSLWCSDEPSLEVATYAVGYLEFVHG